MKPRARCTTPREFEQLSEPRSALQDTCDLQLIRNLHPSRLSAFSGAEPASSALRLSWNNKNSHRISWIWRQAKRSPNAIDESSNCPRRGRHQSHFFASHSGGPRSSCNAESSRRSTRWSEPLHNLAISPVQSLRWSSPKHRDAPFLCGSACSAVGHAPYLPATTEPLHLAARDSRVEIAPVPYLHSA